MHYQFEVLLMLPILQQQIISSLNSFSHSKSVLQYWSLVDVVVGGATAHLLNVVEKYGRTLQRVNVVTEIEQWVYALNNASFPQRDGI